MGSVEMVVASCVSGSKVESHPTDRSEDCGDGDVNRQLGTAIIYEIC